MGTHDGHRERLRQSFTENGLDSFHDVNALELLLFYAIPRKDTNELAHRLLDHFGSLQDVFRASVHELCEVSGISYNTAVLITLIPQLYKKIEVSRSSAVKQIKNHKDAKEYFRPRFINEEDEVLLLLCLDNNRGIICCREVARGTVNTVTTSVKRVVEMAMKSKAASVIISHNHPHGLCNPSREDDHFTSSLFKALDLVGIKLEDHIIVGEKECASLASTGMMNLYRF